MADIELSSAIEAWVRELLEDAPASLWEVEQWPVFIHPDQRAKWKPPTNSNLGHGAFILALPEYAAVLLHRKAGKSKPQVGVVRQGLWVPATETAGYWAGKAYYYDTEPPYIDINLRPGHLLSRPARQSSGVKAPLLEDMNRAVLLPARSANGGEFGGPKLLLDSACGNRASLCYTWRCWGMSTSEENESIFKYKCPEDTLAQRPVQKVNGRAVGREKKVAATTTAARLLAQVLGIDPPPAGEWAEEDTTGQDGFRRGELVKVRYASATKPVHCVVVSPTYMQRRRGLDCVLVVLQCVPWDASDSEPPPPLGTTGGFVPDLIPIGPNGYLDGAGERLSVDVALVRGIDWHSDEDPLVEKTSAQLSEPTINQIDEALRWYYG